MNYKSFRVKLSGSVSLSYGFTFKSAGRFKDNKSMMTFFQARYPQAKLLTMGQGHTSRVAIVASPTQPINTYPGVDALFYPGSKPYYFLIVKTADCLPIMVWDKYGRIGIAHAGWRGSLNRILTKLLNLFLTTAKPSEVFVFMGPGVSFCCYPIYGSRLALFKQAFPDWQDKIIIRHNNRLALDLRKLNFLQAVSLGLPPTNISTPLNCTSCQGDKFFSYIRDKQIEGNIISWIGRL